MDVERKRKREQQQREEHDRESMAPSLRALAPHEAAIARVQPPQDEGHQGNDHHRRRLQRHHRSSRRKTSLYKERPVYHRAAGRGYNSLGRHWRISTPTPRSEHDRI